MAGGNVQNNGSSQGANFYNSPTTSFTQKVARKWDSGVSKLTGRESHGLEQKQQEGQAKKWNNFEGKGAKSQDWGLNHK